jgi:hypothetical protein
MKKNIHIQKNQITSNTQRKTTIHGILHTKVWQEKVILLQK